MSTAAPTASAGRAFAGVTTLFFAWGFITSLIDPLVAAVKSIFQLSNVEAQLSTFAFFIAYGLVSIPAASLIARVGAVRAVLIGLGVMVAGCLVILAGGNAGAYEGVLAGLFLIASGVTLLQVAANPLAAALGSPERSHFRLVLAQAFNSAGTVLGPLVGARLLLRGLDKAAGADALGRIGSSFLLIAGLIALLGVFVWAMRRAIAASVAGQVMAAGSAIEHLRGALASPIALAGAAAIFLYVGAEVSIGSQMALFLHDAAIWGVPLEQAGYYVSLYWFGAMIGRFVGSGLLLRVSAGRVLAGAATGAATLALIVFLVGGPASGYAALAIGLFNSVMFPTIFTLTLQRAGASEEAVSGLLCTAIIGGAFVPLAVGALADANGHAASFIAPALCYAAIAAFGWGMRRTTAATGAVRGGH